MCPNGLSLNKKPSDERNDTRGLWRVRADTGTLGWHVKKRESFRSHWFSDGALLGPGRTLLTLLKNASDETGLMKLVFGKSVSR